MLEPLHFCEVGSHLKSPQNPVWVLGGRDHYTVLSGTTMAALQAKSFVLHHTDPLAPKGAKAERVVVTRDAHFRPDVLADDADPALLAATLRKAWPNARVERA